MNISILARRLGTHFNVAEENRFTRYDDAFTVRVSASRRLQHVKLIFLSENTTLYNC